MAKLVKGVFAGYIQTLSMKSRSNLICRRMKRVSTSAEEESRVGVGLTMSFVRQ